jgi:hypothetical protein
MELLPIKIYLNNFVVCPKLKTEVLVDVFCYGCVDNQGEYVRGGKERAIGCSYRHRVTGDCPCLQGKNTDQITDR